MIFGGHYDSKKLDPFMANILVWIASAAIKRRNLMGSDGKIENGINSTESMYHYEKLHSFKDGELQ